MPKQTYERKPSKYHNSNFDGAALPENSDGSAIQSLNNEVVAARGILHQASISGLIQALANTGDARKDILICLSIPVVLQSLVYATQVSLSWASNLISNYRKPNIATRTIRSSSGGNRIGDRNELLQNAIKLYISHIFEKERKVIQNGQSHLVSFADVANITGRPEPYDSSDYEDNSLYRQLKSLAVNIVPSSGIKIDLGDDVFLVVNEEVNQAMKIRGPNNDDRTGSDSSYETETKVIYSFTAKNPGGAQRIDKFVNSAFDWFLSRASKSRDVSRYLYVMVAKKDAEATRRKPFPPPSGFSGMMQSNNSQNGLSYKRYALSETKTFDNIFFPEKKSLLRLLKDFTEKTNKYAIAGYPHKLGLLLFGEPGTGKTSLIKALAHHTKRHIVSINLAQIETNDELMNAVFDQVYHVQTPFPIRMGFKDVIFVFEDIDAACDAVLSRTADEERDAESSIRSFSPALSEFIRRANEKKAATKSANKASVQEKKFIASLPSAEDQSSDSDSDGKRSDKGDDENASSPPIAGQGSFGFGFPRSFGAVDPDAKKDKQFKKELDKLKEEKSRKEDKLNLAGLLNVLDGIVDSPERIIVMTTNHPEKLDAALIRPGRIDKPIYLSYMRAPEAKELVELYFNTTVTAAQYKRLEVILGKDASELGTTGGRVPAEVEQKCAEYESVDEFLDALDPSSVTNVINKAVQLQKNIIEEVTVSAEAEDAVNSSPTAAEDGATNRQKISFKAVAQSVVATNRFSKGIAQIQQPTIPFEGEAEKLENAQNELRGRLFQSRRQFRLQENGLPPIGMPARLVRSHTADT